MRVNLVHNARFPVEGYGGTERVFWWLAKGLSEKGHEVIVAARPGSRCPFATRVVEIDFGREVIAQLPPADLTHYFFPIPSEPQHPYLITVHGNGKPGERFLRNSVFVSRDHARRHGSQAFVHNGIDPDDYRYSDKKSERLVFCAKASWAVKNVAGAIRIARESDRDLVVIGGKRPWWRLPRKNIRWEGILDGDHKAEILAGGAALVFPVRWHEPFGIAVVEALVSGTPVLATPFGSLPEIVGGEVGRLCKSYDEFESAVRDLAAFEPARCREWALAHFHYRVMTDSYLRFYERVCRGEKINETSPGTIPSRESLLLPIPHHTA